MMEKVVIIKKDLSKWKNICDNNNNNNNNDNGNDNDNKWYRN